MYQANENISVMPKKEELSKELEKEGKRNIKIDFIKGIAIYLVLWGHYIQYTSMDKFDFFENWVFKFIYSFHMPLFMLISGYLFYGTVQKKNLKQIFRSRINGFIIPIATWSMLAMIWNFRIDIQYFIKSFFEVQLWFLWSIVAISICLSLIVKLLPKYIHPVAILLGFFAMYLFPHKEMNLYMYPYFIIGYYFNQNKEKIKQNNIYIYI